MKINVVPPAELNTAIKQAEKIVKGRSRKAYVMSKLLIPRFTRGYLYLCYSYLRWVDDVVDNSEIDVEKKKNFINRQEKLFDNFDNSINLKHLSTEESYLFYFMNYANEIDQKFLIEEVKKMVESMKMDLFRLEGNGVFSESVLANYISIQTNSMFNLVHTFIIKENKNDSIYHNLGTFFWYAATFRDLLEDYNSGFINISREEIEKFNIDIEKLDDDNNVVKHWIKYKIKIVLELLNEEIESLNNLPFKIKIFWSAVYPYYIHKIFRLKTYNYTLQEYIKPSLGKEIKSYGRTIFTSLKIYIRIFKF